MSLDDVLAGLRKSYLASVPEKVARLEALWRASRLEELEVEFHKLKGSGRTYGVPEISQLGELMERICSRGRDSLPDAMPIACELLNRVRVEREAGRTLQLETAPGFDSLVALVEEANRRSA